MKGFSSFLKKEAFEIVRTWRVWVLPVMVLFFAASGPIMARYLPEMLEWLGTSDSGVKIIMAKPTYVDSYAGQWVKNLSQVVMITLIVMYGGLISSERKSGTAALVLTKPVSRTAFVVAKFLAQSAFVTLTVSVGGLITWGLTGAVFGKAPFAPIASATAVWLCHGVLTVALMTLLSIAVNSQAGAAGLGFALWVLGGLLGMWETARLYSPVGLLSLPGALALGKHPAVAWPLVTTFALIVVLVATAAAVFRRQEL